MKKEKKTEKKKVQDDQLREEKTSRITKKDVILMLIITLVYAIVSFVNLGTLTNPQTFWKTENVGDSAIFRIEQGITKVSNLRFYTGVDVGTDADDYYLFVSYDGENYAEPLAIKSDKVFAWQDYTLHGDFLYIKLEGIEAGSYLGEFAIYDENGNKLSLIPMNDNAKLILDEQDTVPDEISYLNSTYFDEVYFPRTAYEHLHNLDIYEWTHPPLGKLLISIPMSIFGMNTFSYRLMGNLAGILMIPAIYCLAKMLFKESKYAVLAAIIMAADRCTFCTVKIGNSRWIFSIIYNFRVLVHV